ncbi:unnamed protein product [Darwinula stevensoni]|uniref:Ribonuclease 3 n=1 Tax=Darwinula stevensoni TaxID=69355 RepID=A0A7R8X5A0_9CRUS|nr:unnamed protein product [Darwinula stevensoni]CAG0884564.1 unnamed protein product [Darwinula stevensoni]
MLQGDQTERLGRGDVMRSQHAGGVALAAETVMAKLKEVPDAEIIALRGLGAQGEVLLAAGRGLLIGKEGDNMNEDLQRAEDYQGTVPPEVEAGLETILLQRGGDHGRDLPEIDLRRPLTPHVALLVLLMLPTSYDVIFLLCWKGATEVNKAKSELKSKGEREGSDGERKHMEKISAEEMLQEEQVLFIRCSPAELFYERDEQNPRLMKGTTQLKKLCEQFKVQLGTRVERITGQQSSENSDVSCSLHVERCSHDDGESGHSESESSEEEGELKNDTQASAILELERKQQHPERLHSELWHNEPGEMNDMPVCRCSLKARKTGIRHGFYEGETHVPPCEPFSNNVSRLHHYRITVSPPTNFLVKTPTVINHDGHEFIFEGFSMLSHFPLEKFPVCGIIRFNIRYAIHYVEEKFPENFCAEELNLFSKILFRDILELYDLDLKAAGDEHGCSQFHFLPRFVRELPDHGKEILSMCYVMRYLLEADQDLIPPEEIKNLVDLPDSEWQNFADKVKGMIVTYPGKKPSSVRVDQLDREQENPDALQYPQLIHFGMRPLQLSYAGNPDYQRAWKEYLKFRYLLANRPKPSETDKHKLHDLEMKAQKLRSHSKLKREVTIALSAEGFRRTGIFCDVIQHAMLLPILICHLRFHRSLDSLEQLVSYHFKNRYLLQLALTHPSYKGNYGTNRDHARNSLTNCGIRQLAYGDRMIHFRRKRGINTLIHIMSLFGQDRETDSNVTHYERLEFLGDAVVEFLSTIHLFFMFPGLEEGGLATYRSALVQNKHLAVLAKKLNLEKYLLYGHGSELCHDSELRHALANSYEAVMAALFLDGGLQVADRIFSETLFQGEMDLLEVWNNLPLHPLQEQEPSGDRHWIESIPFLKELLKFEEYTGLEFKHIRLLARAFTDHSIGFNNLTIGSNERLEFLGDTVLQLIVSDFLYKHFPDHHEGHLSLLRSSLVNNKTQAVVCDDIGLTRFARAKLSLNNWKTKSKADLLEALLGAIFVDRGMTHCYTFCKVCFFPRLQEFIVNQDWIDPKSKLQQCCLTLRGLNCEEPDMPLYKVIESKGPTNRRTYRVAVYFRGKRMAEAVNNSIQQAEMDAAKLALKKWRDLFPQLEHQERVLRKLKQKKGK